MKKIISVFLFFVLALQPIQAFAVEFEIDRTDITASLQRDGQVEVKETFTYTFEGEFNGITRTLIPKENAAITDFRASEDGTELKVEREGDLYKVYRGGSDETVTIDVFYTIENGMEIYEDVAQFYWPFFDKSNESTYQDMTITVEPPERTDVKAAYGFGEAYETAQVNEDGSVTFELGRVPDGKNGDIRVAYDVGLFPNAPVTSDKSMLETIHADKEAMDEKVAAKAESQERWNTFAPFIIGGLLVIALALIFQARRQKQETLLEAERQISGTGSFPQSSLSLPAMIAFTNQGTLSTNALTAALLDLVRKGKIEKLSEHEFKLISRITEYEHEKRLIQWLFDEVGQGDTFHTDDMEAYVEDEKNQGSYFNHFNAWRKAVNEEYRKNGLYQSSPIAKWVAGLAALAALPFTILFPYYGLYGWMAAAIALSLFFIGFTLAYNPLTVEGQRIKQELQPIKFGDQWKSWEKEDQVPALLYQVGSGKRDLLSTPSGEYSASSSDWVIFMLLAANLNNGFRKADEHASVSADSGVGAGGGGAGVGGGGGGSGGF